MTDTILLTVPSGLRGAGVIALVLGGLGSRLDLPVDRIDELALAAATLAPSVQADALELEADVLDDRLVVRIGPLEDGTTTDPALYERRALRHQTKQEKRETTMNTSTIALLVTALVLGVVYMQRRRARLSRED